MNRRESILGILLGGLAVGFAAAAQGLPRVEVWKSPNCGCCDEWVKHLRANGFAVRVNDVGDTTAYRAKYRVPESLGSCHTAVVGGYAIEGHVPAQDIKRLLAQRPKAAGIAVPGMPAGSPGMEGPTKHPYDVLIFDANGRTQVFASYR